MIKLRIAPGLRRSFAAEAWPFIPTKLWRELRDELGAEVLADESPCIFGSDIDAKVVSVAKQNALRAQVAGSIRFAHRDVFAFHPEGAGWLVSNLPYGERIGTPKELERLYLRLRQLLEENPQLHVGLLTSDEKLESALKRRAKKKRKVYNARIKANFSLFS